MHGCVYAHMNAIVQMQMKAYFHPRSAHGWLIAASFIVTQTWKQPDALQEVMDKYAVVHPDRGVLFSTEKE